jgi:hypothetical protein
LLKISAENNKCVQFAYKTIVLLKNTDRSAHKFQIANIKVNVSDPTPMARDAFHTPMSSLLGAEGVSGRMKRLGTFGKEKDAPKEGRPRDKTFTSLVDLQAAVKPQDDKSGK